MGATMPRRHRSCPPPTTPTHTFIPVSLPANLTHPCRRHHHHLCRHRHSFPATIVAIAIARPPLLLPLPSLLPLLPFTLCRPPPLSLSPLPSSLPASLITITITHVVAVTLNCLPPSLSLLLPPKPSLSLLHVAPHPRCQRHCPLHPPHPFCHPPPFPHRHRLSPLILFVTCYYR